MKCQQCGFDNKPDPRATELAGMAIGNVVQYSRILLEPGNNDLFDRQRKRTGEERITLNRVRRLLVRATGLSTLARDKVKEHMKEEAKRKYGQDR